ncbi:MAG: hypothetical protein WEA10_01725 [Actinomycetota bacterium]
MNALKRVLYWEATVLTAVGLVLVVAPGVVFVDLLDQPPAPDGGWMRIAGVEAIGLALVMVLVGQSVLDRWWWSWAFVVVFAGAATVAVLTAVVGLPEGASSSSWWLLSVVSAGLAAVLLWALARAGIERPPDIEPEE